MSSGIDPHKRRFRQLQFREPAFRAEDARTGGSTTATPGEALGPDDAKLPAVRAGPLVNPPNPSKIHKTPVNTGDLYFKNLA